jgi:hypothetical protein
MNNERKKRIGSLAEPLLRGGEWNGVRVMGCGERLVDIGIAIGISITVSLWVAPKVARPKNGGAPGVLALEGVGVGHVHGALENPEFPFVHADDCTANAGGEAAE